MTPDDATNFADLHAVRMADNPLGYTRQLGGGVTATVNWSGDVTLSTTFGTVHLLADQVNNLAGLFTGIMIAHQPHGDWPAEIARMHQVTRTVQGGGRRA